VNFHLCKALNSQVFKQDKPAALSLEHLGVRLCSIKHTG